MYSLETEKDEAAPLINFRQRKASYLSDSEVLAIKAMDELAVYKGEEMFLRAAKPNYQVSFSRDALVAATLRGDVDLLESQVDYSARRMGRTKNYTTGEEPGKVHHEEGGTTMPNGLNSEYNACDTTAEWLRSVAALVKNGRTEAINKYATQIEAATNYIISHLNSDGLFIEDPKFSGDKHANGSQRKYGLKVTYWKDSELNRAGSREPNYPIVYSLAHFQNANALEQISDVTGDEDLFRLSRHMLTAGLKLLWRKDHFITAKDLNGEIDPPSSDSLLCLLYIPPEALPADYASGIERYMERLVTVAGYRASLPQVPDVDPYHMQVWTHEQALLNAAACKHGLERASFITRRVMDYINPLDEISPFPEIIEADTFKPGGNGWQLWTMAAYLYFKNPGRALF